MKTKLSYGLIVVGLISFLIALFAFFEVFNLVPCSEFILIIFSGCCALSLAIMHRH